MKRKKNLPGAVSFDGELTVYRAGEIQKSLSELISQYDECTVDLSAVDGIDSSIMQILIAAKETSLSKNKKISFVNHSREVLRMMDVYGLIGFFGDQIRITSEVRRELGLAYGLKKRGGLHES